MSDGTTTVNGNGTSHAVAQETSVNRTPAEQEQREPVDHGVVAGRPPLTDQQKVILGISLVVHAVIVVFTLRDLRRRPADAVRGPKWMWGVAATLNTSGSAAYWIFGRRRGSRTH